MDLNSFKLLKEDNEHYEIGHPNGKYMRVAKKGLNDKAQKLVSRLRSVQHLAEGGEVEAVSGVPPYLAPNAPEDQVSATTIQEPVAPSAPAPLTSNPEMVSSPAPSPIADAPSQSPVATGEEALKQKNMSIGQSLEEQKSGMAKEAQATAAQNAQEAQQIGKAIGEISLMDSANQIYNKYQQKDADLGQAFAQSKIDPNRFVHNMSTASKISTGIGLLLGGIGSGLTGQPNAAAAMLQRNIDNDIDAQKNDQSNKMNLWKMNRDAYGNDLQANLATQNQLYTALKYKLMATANQFASPAAMARAQQGASLIDREVAQNNQKQSLIDIGLGKAPGMGAGLMAADPAALVPHLVPEQRQKEVFDEIERAQNTKHSSPAILDAFDKAAQEVRPFSGGGLHSLGYALPFQEAPHSKAFEAEMGPTFSKIEGTVRQAAMDNMNKNLKPQFGDSDQTINVKRKALQNYLESTKAAPTAKGFGIDLTKFGTTAAENSKPITKTMNGIQYQQVPGGWKKVQ